VSNAVVHDNLTKPCFNYNFKWVCYRFNCIYKHNCMKYSLVHPAITIRGQQWVFLNKYFWKIGETSVHKSILSVD
jgi:hypothetical protein